MFRCPVCKEKSKNYKSANTLRTHEEGFHAFLKKGSENLETRNRRRFLEKGWKIWKKLGGK